MDYCPNTKQETTFRGVTVEYEEVCRIHKKDPLRCVAFEGTNTGHRIYTCAEMVFLGIVQRWLISIIFVGLTSGTQSMCEPPNMPLIAVSACHL
jgi:hypothetical protein